MLHNIERLTVLKKCSFCGEEVISHERIHGGRGPAPCGGTLITVTHSAIDGRRLDHDPPWKEEKE